MNQNTRRQCYEAGHRPKLLVVIDETEECDRAIHFAARRARRTGASVVMLYMIQPAEFQHWFNVGAVMREEAETEAKAHLARAAAVARTVAGIEPEQVFREGAGPEEIEAFVKSDLDISLLVLAASTSPDGPGPLITAIAGKMAGRFPIPVALVPGHLTDEEIAALS